MTDRPNPSWKDQNVGEFEVIIDCSLGDELVLISRRRGVARSRLRYGGDGDSGGVGGVGDRLVCGEVGGVGGGVHGIVELWDEEHEDGADDDDSVGVSWGVLHLYDLDGMGVVVVFFSPSRSPFYTFRGIAVHDSVRVLGAIVVHCIRAISRGTAFPHYGLGDD